MFHRTPDFCKRECDIIHRISWPMSRLRQTAPAGSQYITPEGARRLRLELELLWRDERPRVTQAGAAAGAQGGRSQNAEYTYRKRPLPAIEYEPDSPSEAASHP